MVDQERNRTNGPESDLATHTEIPEVRAIVSLDTEAGWNKLRTALGQSRGAAAIAVHPFDADISGSTYSSRHDYGSYVNTLSTTVRRYRDLGLPLILFEEEGALAELPNTLDRMGVSNGEVFLITTGHDSPVPTKNPMSTLIRQFTDVGLQRASVVGSYLDKYDRTAYPNIYKADPYPEAPVIFQKYSMLGCVGILITELLTANIKATPGSATFSRIFPRRPTT